MRNKLLWVCAVVAVSLSACRTEPRPLVAGRDVCHNCKMPIADLRFGAELVSTKGKVHVFDDLNCMVHFMGRAAHKETQWEHVMAVDFNQPGKVIDTQTSIFVYNTEMRTPMNSGVAAFRLSSEAMAFIDSTGGVLKSWEETKHLLSER